MWFLNANDEKMITIPWERCFSSVDFKIEPATTSLLMQMWVELQSCDDGKSWVQSVMFSLLDHFGCNASDDSSSFGASLDKRRLEFSFSFYRVGQTKTQFGLQAQPSFSHLNTPSICTPQLPWVLIGWTRLGPASRTNRFSAGSTSIRVYTLFVAGPIFLACFYYYY